jgi:hypothetical protein
MHLNGDYPLNLPYFLLKNLEKMSKKSAVTLLQCKE